MVKISTLNFKSQIKRLFLGILNFCVKSILFPLSKKYKNSVLFDFIFSLVPIVEIKIQNAPKKLKFYCPNGITYWRAKTLLKKEPETIEWIDSFKKDDVFWDVGANVGTYSLYAGMKGIKTLAFEPSAGN